MKSARRDRERLFHPSSEAELIALVERARDEGRSLRVIGSGHSIAAAIYSDARAGLDVSLDRYTAVELDEASGRAVVQAGCRLGDDPLDPSGLATFDASLVAQLDRRGWALPDLGGVTHQTVAGYFMTGSCGGTTRYSSEGAIVRFRFVDGEGRVHDVARGDELFDAFGCSMGLCGIVSTITLQCVPRFDVIGREDIVGERGSVLDRLEAYLRETEYSRLMWWPAIERVVCWRAARMRDGDYGAETGPRGALSARPYDAMNVGAGSPIVSRGLSLAAQWMGGKFYDAVDRARALARRAPRAATALAPIYTERVLPAVLDRFVPLGEPQTFWDSWWHGLPLDNQMSEASMPTTFTELWVPLDRAHEVISALRGHFQRHAHAATGSFAFELYAAPESRFWLHPGYGRESLRVDVFWFERNAEDPSVTFFPQFWELLAPFGYRLHWGKHLPKDERLGVDHLRRQYPRWEDFLEARAALDPRGVFLNRHFAKALGVTR
jgi:FAD/FMN-containing dehydrogenase